MAAGGLVRDYILLEGVPTEEHLVPHQKPFARAKNLLARTMLALLWEEGEVPLERVGHDRRPNPVSCVQKMHRSGVFGVFAFCKLENVVPPKVPLNPSVGMVIDAPVAA